MVNALCRLFLCFVILCSLHFPVYAYSTKKNHDYADTAADGSIVTDDIIILPSAGLSLQGGYFFNNDPGYQAIVNKTIDILLVKYRRINASFLVSEDTIFCDNGGREFYPYKIKYTMDYINLSWDFGYSYLGVVIDHICYNLIDQMRETKPYELRWYGIGVKWESYGMKLGKKNSGMVSPDGIFSSFPVSLNFMFYFGRSLYTEQFNYNYISRGAMRLDFLMFCPIVPYLEVSAQALIDKMVRVDPSAEAGVRIRCGSADIIPYVRYQYKHDSELYGDPVRSYWTAGIGFETLLGEGQWGTSENIVRNRLSMDFMEMHLKGAYTKFYGSGYNGYRSDIDLFIDIVRIHDFSVICNNRMYHDSKADANALFPRYITYTFQGGVEYRLQSFWVLQGIYQHERRHDGNTYRGHEENYHLAGVSVKTIGLKPGYCNVRISDRNVRNIRTVNTLDAAVGAGRIVDDLNYPYRWDLRGQMRWDIYQVWNAVHYLGADMRLLLGEFDEREYGVETGFRFLFGITATLYYRYEKQVDIDFVGGAEEFHHMIGMRIEI
jgi:hypothetical protein